MLVAALDVTRLATRCLVKTWGEKCDDVVVKPNRVVNAHAGGRRARRGIMTMLYKAASARLGAVEPKSVCQKEQKY